MKVFRKVLRKIIINEMLFYYIVDENDKDVKFRAYSGKYKTSFFEVSISYREQLADLVTYPIKVKIDDEYTEIQNRDEFIKNYDKILYPEYKEAMSTAYTKYLFVNYKGIMFGGNMKNMWINDVTPNNGSPKLSITSIIN